MGVFDTISAALQGKTPKADPGTTNKVGYDSRDVENPNLKKMKALGLTAMPDGGQAQLDQMWTAYNTRGSVGKRMPKR